MSSVSRLGITRSSIASTTSGVVVRGTRIVPARSPSTTMGSARERSSLSFQVVVSSTAARSKALRDPLPDHPQRVLEVGAAEQHPRHLGRQVGLATPPLGLLGAASGEVGERRS